MNNSFKIIGNLCRNNKELRIKYYPFKSKRINQKKDKNGNIPLNKKGDEVIDCNNIKIVINFDDETVNLAEIEYYDDYFEDVRYRTSTADNNSELCKFTGTNIQLRFENRANFKSKINNLKLTNKNTLINSLPEDNILYKTRKIINENYDDIFEFTNEVINGTSIKPLNIHIKYINNNKEYYLHHNTQILDTIDQIFLNANKVNDSLYAFVNSRYYSYSYNNIKTLNDDQNKLITYSYDDFMDYYYGSSFQDIMKRFGDYGISLFPDYDKLTITQLNNFIDIISYLGNFSKIIEFIDKVKNETKEIDFTQFKMIPIKFKFNFGLHRKVSNVGYVPLSSDTQIRSAELYEIAKKMENGVNKINENIKNEYNKLKFNKLNIINVFKNVFATIRKDKKNDIIFINDAYHKMINNGVNDIFRSSFKLNKFMYNILGNNLKYLILNVNYHNDNGTINYIFQKNIDKLINNFKILEHMSTNEVYYTNTPSYELGLKLGNIMSPHYKNQTNFSKKVINFVSKINTIRTIKQVDEHYADLISSSILNSTINQPTEFDVKKIFNEETNKIDNDSFKIGYLKGLTNKK